MLAVLAAAASLALVPRPVLSGAEATVGTTDGKFLVHYTLAGADAPPHGMADVDAVVQGLGDDLGKYGVPAPLPDDGGGGDARVDVYVHKLGGDRGLTTPVDVGAGTRSSAFVEVDPASALASETRLAAATAHEALHASQYAVSTALPRWMMEATAAYVEHADFDDATLAAERAMHWAAFFAQPETPLAFLDGSHEYDALVFVAFLVDERHDPRRVGALLAAAADGNAGGPPIAAIEGRPVEDVLATFWWWNLTPTGDAHGPHYAAPPAGVAAAPGATVVVPTTRGLVEVAHLSAALLAVPVGACAPVSVAVRPGKGTAVVAGADLSSTMATVVSGAGPSFPLVIASGDADGDATLDVAAAPPDPQCPMPATATTSRGCRLAARARPSELAPLAVVLLALAAATRRRRRAPGCA